MTKHKPNNLKQSSDPPSLKLLKSVKKTSNRIKRFYDRYKMYIFCNLILVIIFAAGLFFVSKFNLKDNPESFIFGITLVIIGVILMIKKRIEFLYNCYNTSIVYNIILFFGFIGFGIIVFKIFKFDPDDPATVFVLLITAIISFMLMLEQHRVAEAQEKSNTEQRYNNAITQIESKEEGVIRIGFQNLYQLALEFESKDKRKNICKIFCNYLQTESGVKKNGHSFGRPGDSKERISPAIVQFILDFLIKKKNGKENPFSSNWLDLSKVDFQGADFKDAILLKNVQLQGADLSRAQLQGANLEGVQLQKNKLSGVQLQGANLREAQLQGTNLREAQLQGADLSRAQLQGADLSRAQLQGANLENAQLQGAYLENAQLQGADLSGAQLQGANLKDAKLQGASLQGSQLQGADLMYAQFQGADLSGAQLQGADLRYAQLQGAILKEAQFQGTYLSKAQFQEAKFEKTDFSGAYTVPNTSISGQTNLERAVARLEKRAGEPTDLQDVVFSGGVGKYDLPDFKKKRKVFEKVLTDIKYHDKKDHDISNFRKKMDKVENILSTNSGPPNTFIPSSKVITGIYPKADADKVIEDLKRIINDLSA